MYRNLIVSGGIFHDFDATSSALATLLAPLGVRSTVSEDPEAAVAMLESGEYSMLTVNALRWPMHGDKYDDWRADWAFSLSESGRRSLREFVHGGGGLLGLHTASICFGDWPEWRELLGGAWRWGTSYHPPPEPVAVQATAAGTAAGLRSFQVNDERYSDLDLREGIETLLVARDDDHREQPLVWRHQVGNGRVACDLLGHDARSLSVAGHAGALRTLAAWLLEHPASEAAA